MAIFHLNSKTGTRAPARGSKTPRTQSAVAHCAYLARIGKYKDDGEDEVLHLQSGHMPPWALTGLHGKAKAACLNYWRAADAYERVNGRLFRSVEFSLPIELNLSQQIKLAHDFVAHMATTADGQLPFSFAIHRGDGSNPHCHCLVSERVNDGFERTPETWFKRAASGPKKNDEGGARKTNELKSKEWLQKIREHWAELANAALSALGLPATLDHRSHAERGLDSLPGTHLGPHANSIEKRTGQKFRRKRDQQENTSLETGCALSFEIKTIESQIVDLKTRAAYRRLTEDLSIFNKAMTLPSKNVSLVECLNSDKENGNDECETGTLHA